MGKFHQFVAEISVHDMIMVGYYRFTFLEEIFFFLFLNPSIKMVMSWQAGGASSQVNLLLNRFNNPSIMPLGIFLLISVLLLMNRFKIHVQ